MSKGPQIGEKKTKNQRAKAKTHHYLIEV